MQALPSQDFSQGSEEQGTAMVWPGMAQVSRTLDVLSVSPAPLP